MVIWLGLDIIKIKPPKTGSNQIPNVKSKKCIFEVPSNSEMYFAKSCQYVLTCYLRLVNLSTASRGPECVNFLSTCMYMHVQRWNQFKMRHGSESSGDVHVYSVQIQSKSLLNSVIVPQSGLPCGCQIKITQLRTQLCGLLRVQYKY